METGRRQAQLGAEQAHEASQSLEAIANAVATISDMNMLIASSAEEQSAVTEEMNRNIMNINEASEKTSAGTKEIKGSSDELVRLADGLQVLVGQFKV